MCLFDALEEFDPILALQKRFGQMKATEASDQALAEQRSLILRDLAIRARARTTGLHDPSEDQIFDVVDCAVCIEPFFRVETANLKCQHSFCKECLHGRPTNLFMLSQ